MWLICHSFVMSKIGMKDWEEKQEKLPANKIVISNQCMAPIYSTSTY